MANHFDQDTAVERVDADHFEARIDPRWWIVAGPNGGYVAAILLRAMIQVVGDAERAPRSLTVHYTAPAEAAPAQIATRVERSGGSLTTVSARMHQGDRLIALALGAFSKARVGDEFQHAVMPEALPLEEGQLFPKAQGHMIPMHERYEMRWAVDEQPWGSAERARSAAWVRLKEPHVVDSLVAAALTDALPPAIFSRSGPGDGPLAIPTVDLTIHFRTPLPLAGARPDDFTLAVFNTRVVREGFLEEDGEIWSPGGLLLAQSRQLALLL
jgi:acyl-CoA thioesterase